VRGRTERIEKKEEIELSSPLKYLKIQPKIHDTLIWPTCFIEYIM
jgi:hypothetical protein